MHDAITSRQYQFGHRLAGQWLENACFQIL